MKKYVLSLLLGVLIIPSMAFASWWNPFSWNWSNLTKNNTTQTSSTTKSKTSSSSKNVAYLVSKVVDGDTIDVSINGKTERIRLIGINTPETVDPRRPVECFGKEASNKAKSLLSGKKVFLEADSSQGDKDKYSRLLRYVFFENGTNVNLFMIQNGYAYEYTYGTPYKYQSDFKKAQKQAQANENGLWSSNTCGGDKTSSNVSSSSTNSTSTQTNNTSPNSSCTIKGNINSSGEKIFHVVGCGSYDKTSIDESNGEKWFCSEQEALNSGWRKALNCN